MRRKSCFAALRLGGGCDCGVNLRSPLLARHSGERRNPVSRSWIEHRRSDLRTKNWIPAFAGMTSKKEPRPSPLAPRPSKHMLLDAELREDLAGDLFDRGVRGVL